MTYIYNSFAELMADLEKKQMDLRVRGEEETKPKKKEEMLNIAHGQQQIIWILKDTFIGKDLSLMDVKAPAAPVLRTEETTAIEAGVRRKIGEIAGAVTVALTKLDACDRVDAADMLLVVIGKAVEAQKALKGWTRADPSWGARMQDAAKAFEAKRQAKGS